jgi:hypothetical protein
MKILELANKLKAIYDKHGDIEVMFTDPNSEDTFAVELVKFKKVQDNDEFPEEYDMPKGFKFVDLTQ